MAPPPNRVYPTLGVTQGTEPLNVWALNVCGRTRPKDVNLYHIKVLHRTGASRVRTFSITLRYGKKPAPLPYWVADKLIYARKDYLMSPFREERQLPRTFSKIATAGTNSKNQAK
jgi:hypothetical protein